MRSIDPTRDDAGVRLRTLRLRRGLAQVAPADLACVSPAFVSMVETGQRPLRSADHILALSDVLKVSPYYLADGREDASAARRAAGTAPFPARCDPITLARHQQLAQRFIQLARQEGRTTVASSTWNGARQLTAYSDGAANMTSATYDGNGLRASATSTPSGPFCYTRYSRSLLPPES
jgi:YD repeat-containing protein